MRLEKAEREKRAVREPIRTAELITETEEMEARPATESIQATVTAEHPEREARERMDPRKVAVWARGEQVPAVEAQRPEVTREPAPRQIAEMALVQATGATKPGEQAREGTALSPADSQEVRPAAYKAGRSAVLRAVCPEARKEVTRGVAWREISMALPMEFQPGLWKVQTMEQKEEKGCRLPEAVKPNRKIRDREAIRELTGSTRQRTGRAT